MSENKQKFFHEHQQVRIFASFKNTIKTQIYFFSHLFNRFCSESLITISNWSDEIFPSIQFFCHKNTSNLHGSPSNHFIQSEAGRPVGVCHQWPDHCCNGGPHRPQTPATMMLTIILHQMNFTECNVQKNNICSLRSFYDDGILWNS